MSQSVKDFRATKTVLENGTSILCDSDAHFESVCVAVCLLGGLRDETPENLGVSHLLEHVLFKRTKQRGTFEIACAIDSLGGEINACTDADSLCLYGTVRKEDASTLLSFFAELLFSAAFTEGDLTSEREVVRQEILDSRDDPGDVVGERVCECFWPEDMLRYPVFGTTESIECLSHEVLLDRHKALLQGSRLIVAASGAVVQEEFEAQAAALFSALPAGSRPSFSKTPHGMGVSILERSFEQVHFSLAREWPAEFSSDFLPGMLLSTILGEGVSSRLFQKLREDEGLLYDIGTGIDSFGTTGMLSISGAVERSKAARVFELILGETRKVREDLLQEEELERAKQLTTAQLSMERDSLGSRLWRAVETERLYGRYISAAETMAKVESITRDGITSLFDPSSSSEADPLGAGLFGGRGLLVLAGDVSEFKISDELFATCGRIRLDAETKG